TLSTRPTAAQLLNFSSGGLTLTGYTWDNNSYYGLNDFYINANSSFTSWQHVTGWDQHSTFSPNPPTGTWVYVSPNPYEAKRANIIIYNWNSLTTVSVDLSGVLSPEDNFVIKDAQNFFGPAVLTSTYAGGPVSIPMTSTGKSVPSGLPAPASTLPRYATFILLPANSQPGAPFITQQPLNTTVVAGQPATFTITAYGTGLTYQWQFAAPGGSTFSNITGATSSTYTTPATQLADSGTQYRCVVVNNSGNTTSQAVTLTVLPAGNSVPFVTSINLGTIRNDFSGWVGMVVQVGSNPIAVSALGRYMVQGSLAVHSAKIVNAIAGSDVPGSSTSITMSGGSPGNFVYGQLATPVVLNANTTYYVVSQEFAGGDQWYDHNTIVGTANVASVSRAVYAPSGAAYVTTGIAGQTYGPLSFQYTTSGSSGGGPTQPVITQSPQSITVIAGQTATFSVAASGSGLSYQWQSKAPGASSFTNIAAGTGTSYTTPATQVSNSGTQFQCVVQNSGGSVISSAATLTVQPPPPPPPTTTAAFFVTSDNLGTLRNDYSCWVGMVIQVGATPLGVKALGRIMVAGNTGTHLVKIVNASTGLDLPGGSVSVTMTGATPGYFVYQALPSPVTLNAYATYYFLTQETQGADQWYDYNTTVQTTTAASVTAAVYSYGPSYVTTGYPGQTYGPVDFQYGGTGNAVAPSIISSPQNTTVLLGQTSTFGVQAAGNQPLSFQWQSKPAATTIFTNIPGATASTYTTPPTQLTDNQTQFQCIISNDAGSVTTTPVTLIVKPVFVTAKTLGTIRNDYSGWVGMTIQTGANPVTVTALGRIVAPGNSSIHLVKIVNASTGTDIPGASASVNTAGGSPGDFVYAPLASAIVLSTNTTYYILTQETQGGDQWYDYDTLVWTTTVATVTSAVYGPGTTYVTPGYPGQTYGPVDFQYAARN
ncbi:MAG: immunoglobulin domain-containing protein, partial [Acidobacteriia bacterium]|nr:immunoglobulin domain-containing protein [Terriglobia bacterium]